MPARALLTLLALGALMAFAAPAGAAGGRWIVTYEPSAGPVDAETAARERAEGFDAGHVYRRAVRGFSARLSAGQVRALRADPEVASVTPDRPVQATATPTGVRRIGAVSGTTARGASTVGVAVVDTGIDLDHPALNVAPGVDCTGTGSTADDNGHGTHVAGTIASRKMSNGVVGVAPATKVYAVKVLGADGSGLDSQVICGLDWVAQHAATLNIKVANLSLGGPGSKSTCGTLLDPLHEAVCRTTNAGVSVVVAAGNDGRDFGASPVDTPAWYPESLTVTAMSDGDGLGGAVQAPSCDPEESDDYAASFSNFAVASADVSHTIAAPGVCILSTYLDGYAIMSGTSMAAPHVAGEVALCLGEDGASGPCTGKTPAQILSSLRADAALAAGQGFGGFFGDPQHAISNRSYGYLGRAPGATVPSAPSQPPAGAPTTSSPVSNRPPWNPPTVTYPQPPPATSPCRIVKVRVKRVTRKVRIVRRHGHKKRIVKRIVRWRVVPRLRCG